MKPGVTRKKLNLMPQLSHVWKDVDRSGRKKSWTNQKQNLCFEVARESDSKARDLHASHLWLNFVTSCLCLRSGFGRKLICHFKERKMHHSDSMQPCIQSCFLNMLSVADEGHTKQGKRRKFSDSRATHVFSRLPYFSPDLETTRSQNGWPSAIFDYGKY